MKTVEEKALNEIEKQQKEAGIAFLGVIQLEVPEFNAVKNALEKQIPKKPKSRKNTTYAFCPCCDSGNLQNDYCTDCGQKIDWSETEKGGAEE